MYSQEALSLIEIAQFNPADRSQVVRRLWNIHEKSLMKYAVRLSRTMEPDFAMRGMNDAARRFYGLLRDRKGREAAETIDDLLRETELRELTAEELAEDPMVPKTEDDGE